MPDIETKKDRLKTELGDVVKYLRLKKKITQLELAKETDLSVSAISKIEQGIYDIKLFSFLKLSDGLDIDPGLIVSALNEYNQDNTKRAILSIQRGKK